MRGKGLERFALSLGLKYIAGVANRAFCIVNSVSNSTSNELSSSASDLDQTNESSLNGRKSDHRIHPSSLHNCN